MFKLFEEYNFMSEIDEIDISDFDINNISNIDMFDYIYEYSPKTIKDYINSLKHIEQRLDYHPEGSVYNHTKAVLNRLAKTKDINLILAAFLHDTGKDRTLKIEDGIIMQPGHEAYSAELLNIKSPWRTWVRLLGGDPDTIRFIILNHMKMKFLNKNNKKIDNWFNNLSEDLKNYLNLFNDADHGGV